MDKLEKPLSIKTRCELAGVKYSSVRGYIERHRGEDLDIDSIIQMYKEKDNNKKQSFSALCKQYDIDYNRARGYKQRHRELTDIQIIQELNKLDIRDTFKDKCIRAGIGYENACGYKGRFPNLTDEQVLEHLICVRKEKENSLQNRLNNLGITSGQFYGVRQTHKDKTADEIIEIILSRKEKVDNSNLRKLCNQHQINYESARQYKKRNSSTDEDTMNYFIQLKEKITFTQKCINAGISTGSALQYKSRHPELTDEQIIMYYRPDCYINWIGELVVPN